MKSWLGQLRYTTFAVTCAVTCAFACACTPDGGGSGGSSAPKKDSTQTPITPTNEGDAQCIPSAANNQCAPAGTGIEKCWNKLLDTQQAQACAASGKIYNRIKKICVDAGIKLKPGCNIPAGDLKAATDQLTAELGSDVDPQVDQCGSYTSGGREFQVAYVLAKKYTGGPEGFGSYIFRVRMLCYRPSTGNDPTCSTPDLLVSGASNDQPGNLSCD
jgi:hypothetical protein